MVGTIFFNAWKKTLGRNTLNINSGNSSWIGLTFFITLLWLCQIFFNVKKNNFFLIIKSKPYAVFIIFENL